MKLKLTIVIAFGCCWLLQAQARGGGSVVNNGAGIVEQNFQYAYVTIDKLASQCALNDGCKLSSVETRILEKISQVTQVNLLDPQKIIFISEKDNAGFFTTGPSEKNRIAKTSLDADSPIYVNRDMLYKKDGTPAIAFPAIVAILTHELGHQTGEPSHEILDTLGAKLRLMVEQNVQVYKIGVSTKTDVKASVSVLNFESPVKTAEVLVTWGNVFSRSLTEKIKEKLNCSSPFLIVEGYEITNGHFNYIENDYEIGFEALVNLHCRSSFSQAIIIEKRDLTFYINRDSNIRNFKVDYWWGF